MKTSTSIVVLACVLASASAFSAPFATRAVGKKAAKKVTKKAAPKSVAVSFSKLRPIYMKVFKSNSVLYFKLDAASRVQGIPIFPCHH